MISKASGHTVHKDRYALGISAFGHGAALVGVLLSGVWNLNTPSEVRFEEVEIIDAASFEALVAQAEEGLSGEKTSEPVSTPETQSTPAAPAETAVAQPQVTDPGLADPSSQGREQSLETTTIDAPPPRAAAEIRDLASASETLLKQSNQEALQEAPVEAPKVPEVPKETQDAQKTDATTDILPEAQKDAPQSSAPKLDAPPTRPKTIADLPLPPDPLAKPNTPDLASSEKTTETAKQSETPSAEDEIDALLGQVLEETGGSGTGEAQGEGRGLSQIEQGAVIRKIQGNWIKTAIVDKPDYERLVVVVEFRVMPGGDLSGSIVPVDPAQPSGEFEIAYRAAENAIRASLPFEIPSDVDAEGIVFRLRFDPAMGDVNLY